MRTTDPPTEPLVKSFYPHPKEKLRLNKIVKVETIFILKFLISHF